jgi:hypothetical protein
MKKNRGDNPIVVIIHTYMEISQGNSLCRYLYVKEAKMSCFSFYLLFFLLKNWKKEGQNRFFQGKGSRGSIGTGVGKRQGKGTGR